MPEREDDPRWARLLGLLAALSSAVAFLACRALDLRPLDTALWAVLAPVGATLLMVLARLALRRPQPRPRLATVVLPDSAEPVSPDPAVQARDAAVELARQLLLDARERGASTDELLGLARALHEATLEQARALAAAGGHVPQALRDEIALRDRSAAMRVDSR